MKTITYDDFVSFDPCWLTDAIERAGRFEKMCRMIDAVIDWWRPDFLFKKRGAGSPLMDVMWCVWQVGNRKTVYIPLDKPEPPKGE